MSSEEKNESLKLVVTEGQKFDHGKPDLSHISQILMEEVARVLQGP